MANAGTLLSDLDGKAPLAGDSDLVKMIYHDMNSGQDMRPGMGLPSGMAPGGVQGPMMPMPPPQQSTQHYQMDPGPSTAHIIGGQHPTSADFAQMLQSSTPGFAAGGNWASSQGYGQTGSNSQQAQLAAQIANMQASQGKAWSNMLSGEMKTPILIAILVFIVNLPFLSVLVAHYAPWMLKASGDMNMYGQLSKALLVGFMFWGANRIILPLLG
ncbi:MAG: hypothetical protein EBU66_13790 [Bacteroidetes bacterium]|jgi:hypothetical protein|nr:hypothetical protein [bacterium]NBP65719.1 hypothetical protein [Bacteroidota bacterium]